MSLSSTEQKEIQEILSQVGLSELEQRAYLALLEHGVTTATPIAGLLSVPLTTAQSLLQRLAKRGVVHVTKRKSRSVYEAKDPIAFKTLLEQTLQEVTQMIPLLRTLKTEQAAPMRVRIYQRERMTDIFRQALLSKEKLVYEIVSAKDLQDILGERFHFTKRRMTAGIRLKSLRIEAREIKKYSPVSHVRELREAKFLPKELDFHCSVLLWDQTVAFFTAANEGVAWVVQSASLSYMVKQLFELLWSISRKMETGKEGTVS
jgi:sugar-specific transcriptional regulator TrmB